MLSQPLLALSVGWNYSCVQQSCEEYMGLIVCRSSSVLRTLGGPHTPVSGLSLFPALDPPPFSTHCTSQKFRLLRSASPRLSSSTSSCRLVSAEVRDWGQGGNGSLGSYSPGILPLQLWLDPFWSRSRNGFLLHLVPESSHSWRVSLPLLILCSKV